jgi:phosphoribosylformylglycinamidine synthase
VACESKLSHFPELDPARCAKVHALVLTGYGLNCEAETSAAFEMLGCQVTRLHVGEMIESGGAQLADAHIVAFIGGFSFGDHVASGRVYANRLRHRFGDALAAFVDRGGLAIGMCNGFQTMVKLGILPAMGRQAGAGLAPAQTSLVDNDRRGYRNAWVEMVADPESPCVWTRGVADFACPSRHGEGKLIFESEELFAELDRAKMIPLRYVDSSGQPTEHWPENPNGSRTGAAALCDESGRLFGLMPHPEAYLYPENHPRWIAQRDAGELPKVGAGLRLFANGVQAAVQSFGL